MEMIIYFIFLLLPHMSNAILCRICTNCELESEEIFSMCDVNQSCYTLNRIHSKMTEMGCGTSCSLMERVRRIDDPCHLCHYDMCNSGKKIIVQRNQIKTTTIINNLKERAKPDSYVEKDIAPFPIDETNPFPIEMVFPHRIVSSSEISKMNGSLITQATDSLNSLPIPIDESPASNREKSEKEGFIHFYYPHDILDEEFEKEVESNLNSKVDNERAERDREEERENDEKQKEIERSNKSSILNHCLNSFHHSLFIIYLLISQLL